MRTYVWNKFLTQRRVTVSQTTFVSIPLLALKRPISQYPSTAETKRCSLKNAGFCNSCNVNLRSGVWKTRFKQFSDLLIFCSYTSSDFIPQILWALLTKWFYRRTRSKHSIAANACTADGSLCIIFFQFILIREVLEWPKHSYKNTYHNTWLTRVHFKMTLKLRSLPSSDTQKLRTTKPHWDRFGKEAFWFAMQGQYANCEL